LNGPALDKVTALIAGVGSTYGRSAALELARAGVRLALNDLNPDRLNNIAAEAAGLGERFGQTDSRPYTIGGDLATKLAVQTLFNTLGDAWGAPQIVINASKAAPVQALLDLDEWEWRRALDFNLTGAFLLTQITGRILRAAGMAGLILHLIDSRAGRETSAAYAAAAAGLEALAQAADRELAGSGIRVLSLSGEDMFPDPPQTKSTPPLLSLIREVLRPRSG